MMTITRGDFRETQIHFAASIPTRPISLLSPSFGLAGVGREAYLVVRAACAIRNEEGIRSHNGLEVSILV